MVFCFAGMNNKAIMLKVNVFPFQPQDFAGASQTAEAGKSEDQPPLGIRASVKHALGYFRRHKEEACLVGPNRYRLPLKWVFTDKAVFNGGVKKLPAYGNMLSSGILGKFNSAA